MQNLTKLLAGIKYTKDVGSKSHVGCGNLDNSFRRDECKYVIVDGDSWKSYDKDNNILLVSCCTPLKPSGFKPYSSPVKAHVRISENTMDTNLKLLTEEQKKSLSKGDQALIELEIVNDNLTVLSTTDVVDFLYRKFKKDLEKEAIEKVAKIKADAGMAKKKS